MTLGFPTRSAYEVLPDSGLVASVYVLEKNKTDDNRKIRLELFSGPRSFRDMTTTEARRMCVALEKAIEDLQNWDNDE